MNTVKGLLKFTRDGVFGLIIEATLMEMMLVTLGFNGMDCKVCSYLKCELKTVFLGTQIDFFLFLPSIKANIFL